MKKLFTLFLAAALLLCCMVGCGPTSGEAVVESAEFSAAEYTVFKGTTVEVAALVSPSDLKGAACTWKSSDETVATVQGDAEVSNSYVRATVTAVKAGTASVTVSFGDVSASTKIIVKDVMGVEAWNKAFDALLTMTGTIKIKREIDANDTEDSEITINATEALKKGTFNGTQKEYYYEAGNNKTYIYSKSGSIWSPKSSDTKFDDLRSTEILKSIADMLAVEYKYHGKSYTIKDLYESTKYDYVEEEYYINQLEGGELGNLLYNVFIYFKDGKITTLIIECESLEFKRDTYTFDYQEPSMDAPFAKPTTTAD